MVAKDRLLGNDIEQGGNEYPVDDRHDHVATETEACEGQKFLREDGSLALHEVLRHRAEDFHCAERDNEWWDAAVGDEYAVEGAKQGTEENDENEGDDESHPSRDVHMRQPASGRTIR